MDAIRHTSGNKHKGQYIDCIARLLHTASTALVFFLPHMTLSLLSANSMSYGNNMLMVQTIFIYSLAI